MSDSGPVDSRHAELQQWLEAAEAEAETLRVRVAELEARAVEATSRAAAEAEGSTLITRVAELGATQPDSRTAELQQWLDAAEADAEALRAKVAELQARPQTDSRAALLQQWLENAEADKKRLAERVATLEASAGSASGPSTEAFEAATAEVKRLRGQVAELECVIAAGADVSSAGATLVKHRATAPGQAATEAQLAEVQQWLAAAEAENARLRASLDGAARPGNEDVATLRERISELEAGFSSARALNERLLTSAEATATRDVERLTRQLHDARADPERFAALERAIAESTETVATLTSERAAALAQVRQYAGADQAAHASDDRRHQAALDQQLHRVAELETELKCQAEDLAGFRQRISAWERRDLELQTQLKDLTTRCADAEARLGETTRALELTQTREAEKDARLSALAGKADEAARWLADAEAERDALAKKVDALTLEVALARQAQATAPVERPKPVPPPPPADANDVDDETSHRVQRLEQLLEREQQTSSALRRFADVSERSLARATDDLELALARLKDLRARLGDSDAETSEALDRLLDSQAELASLRAELARTSQAVRQVEEAELVEEVLPEEAEVAAMVSAPLAAVDALAEAQAKASKQATEALQSEQRAREALLSDLQWLKAEVEKLSTVREDLRARLGTMVKRELDRKALLQKLLATLRSNEVTSAARLSATRRLEAAVEHAQRMAVKVQTIYFQKQIGSLQRQLEKERKAALLKKSRAA